MTITTNDARDEYTSGAGQTVFNYTFKIFASDELDVYVTPAGQEANDSTDLTTDYVVDSGTIGNEAGGFITFNTPLSAGDKVTIASGIPYDRTTDYQFNGDFNPTTVNNDNDRQTAQIKQVLELARKAVVFGQAQQGTSGLTSEAPEAGKFIRWKSDLSGFENTDLTDVGSLVPVSSIDVVYPTVADMKADALNVLDVGIIVSTQGYYAAGDGGGSTYLVASNQAVDGYVDHILSNGNVALLQGGSIDLKQSGSIGDGTTESTVNVQAALDSRFKIVTYLSGVFICDQLSISNPITFTGMNSGAVIKAKDLMTGSYLVEVNASNVNIIDGEFDGSRLNNTGKNIIHKLSGDDFNCSRNKIHDGSNIGVVCRGGKRLRIEDNEVYDCTFKQIIINSTDAAISDVSMARNNAYLTAIGINTDNGGIGFNAPANSISNVSIVDNRVDLIVDAAAPVNHVCIEVFGEINQFNITGNNTNGGRLGISCAGGSNGVIVGNSVFRPLQIGIEVAVGGSFNSSNVAINGNTVNGSDSAGTTNTKGVAMTSNASGTSVKDIHVSDNKILNCFLPIQALETSPGLVDGITIHDNNITMSTDNGRIDIDNVGRVSVKGNRIDLNNKLSALAVKLLDCNVFDVSDNFSYNGDATSFGIQVVGSSVDISYGSVKDNNYSGAGGGVSITGYIRYAGDTGANVTGIFEVSNNVGFVTPTRNSDDGNPSVAFGDVLLLSGSSSISDFIHGYDGKKIEIRSTGTPTIQNSANLRLAGGVNYSMTGGDTLVLRQFSGGVWTEISRSVN